ncbi:MULTISPECIES: DUF2232 domain-containing protein [Fischerella]|jgi:uncharacterized protein YybS (DUF2232 family)|uniref:DUF2232 domain-containing protein n=4 Tax=Fischerella TaxID=1190 RepID=G6FW63_9CYAN|nr:MULTISPECIES: DUF2232 domain-containing protein [Fischerella]PLZ89063.1 DUF2232 domain-containing protein [Fischerella thermalis CCMEE 5196]PMB05249.1 DUF2232 domain-containing protein [Fischerella thermalis CCMEE 5273]PMB14242.1 DUF2232 domain-containing protein [Fischerella thermalis CCMEE 5319]RDH50117.1 hypothetical protein CBF18_13185 [Mastigocladus laminosus WC112]BCX07837.1 MAG: membrane protein [Fischerella sp.]
MTEKPVDQQNNLRQPQLKLDAPLRMMETAFLASTASLIWFINFYFPLGPLLRIFFPVPIALVYLRWGKRAAWMGAVTSGLLLSVLMGPIRSLLFVMPFAFMGVLLGAAWYRRVPWIVSISLGAVLGTLGVFFRLWLLSLLSGEDLWVYVINQVTEIVEWIFLRLGILASPSTSLINSGAIALIIFNNFLYLFIVHIAAWLLLDRLGNPIPRPPRWVQVLMDYE